MDGRRVSSNNWEISLDQVKCPCISTIRRNDCMCEEMDLFLIPSII